MEGKCSGIAASLPTVVVAMVIDTEKPIQMEPAEGIVIPDIVQITNGAKEPAHALLQINICMCPLPLSHTALKHKSVIFPFSAAVFAQYQLIITQQPDAKVPADK